MIFFPSIIPLRKQVESNDQKPRQTTPRQQKLGLKLSQIHKDNYRKTQGAQSKQQMIKPSMLRQFIEKQHRSTSINMPKILLLQLIPKNLYQSCSTSSQHNLILPPIKQQLLLHENLRTSQEHHMISHQEQKAQFRKEQFRKNIEDHSHAQQKQILQNLIYEQYSNDLQLQKNTQCEYIQNIESLLSALQKQMDDNKQIYEQFLPIQELQKIIDSHQTIYLNQDAFNDTVKIVLDFLAFCKNKSGAFELLETTFTNKFYQELPLKWQKIRQPTFFYNKSQLKILSYLVENPQSKVKRYENCFQNLKFNFFEEEADQVAKLTKDMANEDVRSFCFLSGYLLSSCYKMEEEGKPIKQIQERYMKIIKMLDKNYKPAEQYRGDPKELSVHQSFLKKELIPELKINLKEFQTKKQKEKGLNTFIMERANESMHQFDKFYSLTKKFCYKNDGFGFKAGVKIKNVNQKSALLRIKEKMLTNIYEEKKKKLQEQMKQSNAHQQFKVQGINEFVKRELKAYEERMEEIFQSHSEPIQFKVSDMLRGKCMFIQASKINQCCSDIIEAVSKDETLKLIEVDNRLAKPTSDITLKILFGNVIAQLQLGMNRKVADYEFSHKIYELVRSKFFTPLCQLSILNQSLSKDYFSEVSKMVEVNIKSSQDFEETVTFSEVGEGLKWYLSFLKTINVDIEANYTIQVDKRLMKYSETKLKSIIECKLAKINKKEKAEINLNFGRYFYEMHQYKQSLSQMKKGLDNCKKYMSTEVQTIKCDLNYLGGLICYEQGNYSKALEHYQRCLEIQQNIKGKESIDTSVTLNSMGLVFYSQGNYNEALKYYENSLKIDEHYNGRDGINIALTLNNIGLIHKAKGNYRESINCYQRCLKIQENVNGKGSIKTCVTLSNIGLLYRNLGNYSEALKYYQRCLQIKQNIKGKGSFDTAITLNNIGLVYKKQESYSEALKYYQCCLEIEEKVKGKGSIDTALTLSNIGMVYKSLGNYSKALENYQRCLEIEENIKGKGSISTALSLNNIGMAYKSQGKYQLSAQYLEKASNVYISLKISSPSLFVILDNIGGVYIELKEYQKAIKFYKQSIDGSISIGHINKAKYVFEKLTDKFKGINRDSELQELRKIYGF